MSLLLLSVNLEIWKIGEVRLRGPAVTVAAGQKNHFTQIKEKNFKKAETSKAREIEQF